jgi:hypothetical protein
MIFMKSLLMGSALGCEGRGFLSTLTLACSGKGVGEVAIGWCRVSSSDCLEVTMVDGGTVEVSAERIVSLSVEMEGFGR